LQEDGSRAESRRNPIPGYGEETTEPIRGSFDGPISYAIYPLTPRIPELSQVLTDTLPSIARRTRLRVFA
jgi:hypothetical protein